MRIGLILIAMLSFSSTLVSAQEEATTKLTYADEGEVLDQANVRGFIWGLPSSIIKAEETVELVEEAEDGTLFYVDIIRGIKSSITYEFEDDKLYRVRIFSEKKYTRPQERMQDLVRMKRDLDTRFGEPAEENFKWLSNTDKESPEQWGWAVYRGDLIVNLIWKDEETQVTAYLGSERVRYKPDLFVMYEDIKRKNDKKKRKEAAAVRILP